MKYFIHILVTVSDSDRYFELSPDAFYVDAANTFLVGLGVGILAAGALSLASNITDLCTAGAEAVRQAFRLGILVDEVAQNLQPLALSDTDTRESWAYVVPNISPSEVQQELDNIQTKEVSAVPGPAYKRDTV